MTPAKALEAIRGYAAANRIVVTEHARQRMRPQQRGVSYDDLRHALATATGCREQANERWRVEGADLDGDELSMIVAIEGEVVVVTLF